MVSRRTDVILFDANRPGGPSRGSGVPSAPNEHGAADDRRDCYWLYVVTNCDAEPTLATIKDPARLNWQEVTKVYHYTIAVSALTN